MAGEEHQETGQHHRDDRASLERRDEARLGRENQSRERQPEFTLSGGNGTSFLFRSLMAFSILESSSSFNKETLSP
jgi:hypothetical protein